MNHCQSVTVYMYMYIQVHPRSIHNHESILKRPLFSYEDYYKSCTCAAKQLLVIFEILTYTNILHSHNIFVEYYKNDSD